MAERSDSTDILLLHMPFGPIHSPSLGLGLLKAGLERKGFSAIVRYLSISFARMIGVESYVRMYYETHPTLLLGEWIFSQALFGPEPDGWSERYVDLLERRSESTPFEVSRYLRSLPDELINAAVRAREQVGAFLDRCATEVLARNPRIVGFSSIFQQQIASLALARRLKQRRTDLYIVFGGANCEGALGQQLLRSFAVVDAVVSGEGDTALPSLVERVLHGEAPRGIPGVHLGGASDLQGGHATTFVSMDELPIPDFEDYFRETSWSSSDGGLAAFLPFETSRGCWWGSKHQCTFCGLNGESMAYRRKSARRAVDELGVLTDRHPGLPICAADNILDMGFFRDFIPALSARSLDIELFYEVKANLRKDQLQQLRNAGITVIQVGIESLSDHVLALMHKGTTSLQNIQLLKWCREIGIVPLWNVLWGLSGERPEDYDGMVTLIDDLWHLKPPHAAVRARIDRFSPMFEHAARHEPRKLEPYPAYALVYRLPKAEIRELAYFFTVEETPHPALDTRIDAISRAIERWRRSEGSCSFYAVPQSDCVILLDTRPVASKRVTVLDGLAKEIYLLCDRTQRLPDLVEALRLMGMSAKVSEVKDSLAWLVSRRAMLQVGGTYLALAVQKTDETKSDRPTRGSSWLRRQIA